MGRSGSTAFQIQGRARAKPVEGMSLIQETKRKLVLLRAWCEGECGLWVWLARSRQEPDHSKTLKPEKLLSQCTYTHTHGYFLTYTNEYTHCL